MFRGITLALASLVAACSGGDAPLLRTALPNGYLFESNGGHNGFVRKPDGRWLSDHFGIQADGSEPWCSEFGWRDAVVVCRMSDEAKLPSTRDLGYFILDTASGSTHLVGTGEEAMVVLNTLSVETMPTLAMRHGSTERR